MNFLKQFLILEKKKKKELFLCLVMLFLISIFFIFGYILGKYKQEPSLGNLGEKIEKTFTYGYKYGDRILEIKNTIKYPHSWEFKSFDEKPQFQVSSDDKKMVITITPKRTEFASQVLSAQLNFELNIVPKCIGTQKVFDQNGAKEISTYRLRKDDLSFEYIQKVFLESVEPNGTERYHLLDSFIVLNPDFIINNEDSLVWMAEITAEFNGLETEINNYIATADEIVASLRIKEEPLTSNKIDNNIMRVKIAKILSPLFQL